MKILGQCILLWIGMVTVTWGAGFKMDVDQATGWKVYSATRGKTSVKLAPAAGCNLYSLTYDGVELLRQPPSLKELPGFHYGNPILYPSPNRVRESKFSFGGKTYQFTPNDGKNFLHGIVHSSVWEVTDVTDKPESVTFHCELKFAPGSDHFKLFPLEHVLKHNITVTDGAVKFEFVVDNTQGKAPVPFGWAYHPWFLYQGARANTYLTVPAAQRMEVDDKVPPELLPTGKLIDVAESRYDCRSGRSLGNWFVDDVWFGLTPDKPAVIDFLERSLKITLKGSEEFTHLVVYTPLDEPWFCVENQTCSTDAHNLHAKGLTKESHLMIVEPGKTRAGTVEFSVRKN